jgi:hypothetical protein
MGCSSGPNIKLFERFSASWNHIDNSFYEPAMNDDSLSAELQAVRDDLISFFRQHLQDNHPRDDYRELLQLAMLFLGDEQSNGIHINTPGAYHRAHWMAKIIYSLKIYLFRSQFKLTASELSGLKQFNMFVVRLYLKAWYTCTLPTCAPRNDLQLLKDLVAYRKVSKSIANAALQTFLCHLWYLSESLVGLAFFDSEVSVMDKAEMVAALSKEGEDNPLPRVTLDEQRISETRLADFVNQGTKKFFDSLNISQNFLLHDPNLWNSNDEYVTAQTKLKKLKVVNDAAERGVALIQSFNSVLTNQEEQKQFLLQVVESHRQKFPEPKKSVIVQELSN